MDFRIRIVALTALLLAPFPLLLRAQGDARTIAEQALHEEGGTICATATLPAFGDRPISVLALFDAFDRGSCNLIVRIAAGNPSRVIQRIPLGGLRNLSTVLRDLDHDGDVELVVPDQWGGGRHYRCEPQKMVVYRCDASRCTDASDGFPGYFAQELNRVNESIARLQDHVTDAEVAERRCDSMERDRLMRLLKMDPHAGFATAEHWMLSANPDDRVDAVAVFTSIGDASSKERLRQLIRDPEAAVAILARDALGLPRQP